MTLPTIEDQIIKSVAEHEVLLSFNDDGDAVLFVEWLEGPGFDEFSRYAQDVKE